MPSRLTYFALLLYFKIILIPVFSTSQVAKYNPKDPKPIGQIRVQTCAISKKETAEKHYIVLTMPIIEPSEITFPTFTDVDPTEIFSIDLSPSIIAYKKLNNLKDLNQIKECLASIANKNRAADIEKATKECFRIILTNSSTNQFHKNKAKELLLKPTFKKTVDSNFEFNEIVSMDFEKNNEKFKASGQINLKIILTGTNKLSVLEISESTGMMKGRVINSKNGEIDYLSSDMVIVEAFRNELKKNLSQSQRPQKKGKKDKGKNKGTPNKQKGKPKENTEVENKNFESENKDSSSRLWVLYTGIFCLIICVCIGIGYCLVLNRRRRRRRRYIK